MKIHCWNVEGVDGEGKNIASTLWHQPADVIVLQNVALKTKPCLIESLDPFYQLYWSALNFGDEWLLTAIRRNLLANATCSFKTLRVQNMVSLASVLDWQREQESYRIINVLTGQRLYDVYLRRKISELTQSEAQTLVLGIFPETFLDLNLFSIDPSKYSFFYHNTKIDNFTLQPQPAFLHCLTSFETK